MALVSERSLSLNPNAPLFIPFALRNVEDFSPKWWELVKTSPWFRDYWLSEHQEDDFDSNIDDSDINDALLERFDLDAAEEFRDLEAEFEEMILSTEAGEKYEPVQIAHQGDIKSSEMDAKKVLKDLVISKSPRKRGPKSPAGLAKYREKPAKCVSPKCAPRFIHQPR